MPRPKKRRGLAPSQRPAGSDGRKTVKLREETVERLLDIGGMRDTFDDLVLRLIATYHEHKGCPPKPRVQIVRANSDADDGGSEGSANRGALREGAGLSIPRTWAGPDLPVSRAFL